MVFVSFYMLFWLWFFAAPDAQKNIQNKQLAVYSYPVSAKNDTSVLGAQTSVGVLPQSFEIAIEPRRQFYNLSCEFAAASGIIYHFTSNPNFAVANESIAEKTLINDVVVSKNPNVGLRMGDTASLEDIYTNLNQKFGGSDYYGIHAPPFFDIFTGYNLVSKPIYINDSTVSSIKQAISSGHLVMAWIKIGYEKPIDDSLSYGTVKIIKGEHAVIISGYDENGVTVMDPGIGAKRYIDYSSLLDASSFFPIPFLEVYRSTYSQTSDLIIGIDTPTEINRSVPKIYVENGAGDVGVANQMRDILKDFGYNVVGLGNADNFDYENVSIETKKDFSDFSYILKKDLKVASFIVATSSADLTDNSNEDIIVIVGK